MNSGPASGGAGGELAVEAKSKLRAPGTTEPELGETDVEPPVGAGMHHGEARARLLVPRDGEAEELDPPL